MDKEDIIQKIIVIAIIIGFVLFIYWLWGIMAEKHKIWEEFKQTFNCKIVAVSRGSIGSGVGISANGSVGLVTVIEDDKTAWLCDDGITYWR